ncbi:UxaA family hydrolase [Jannaschia sp. M317]|uniref:UxaA family hydrolase n=1 Tax=Jannaschia sp. M317 TaxID=2867011 RepID=UPI0021A92749|nr:UxaA family hydrolase [Jannaschia sp. M317]UWQ18046.1 UxaA family hydrolase [Jannaschia sp. M317]
MKLLHLHRSDNVAVLAADGRAGDRVALASGGDIVLPCDLVMGHKIAIRAIPAGADVLKYGCPIGYAATDIAVGDHVHLHNLTSRYTVIEDMEAAGQ